MSELVRKKIYKISIWEVEEDEFGGEWEVVKSKRVIADVCDYIFQIFDNKLKLDFFPWSGYIEKKCRKVAKKLGLEFKGFSEPDIVEPGEVETGVWVAIYYDAIFAKGDKQFVVTCMEIVPSSAYEDANIRIATEKYLEKQLKEELKEL